MRRRVIILLNTAKPDARAKMASLTKTVNHHAEVVGTGALSETQGPVHRPLVVGGQSSIEVFVRQANAGTTVVLDGQVTAPWAVGDRLLIRRCSQDFQRVHNPTQP